MFISQERELELQKEQRRQEENDKLRQEFAQHANAFHQWIQETRYSFSFQDLPLGNSLGSICMHPPSLWTVILLKNSSSGLVYSLQLGFERSSISYRGKENPETSDFKNVPISEIIFLQ